MKKVIVFCLVIVSLFGCSTNKEPSENQILDYSKLLYKVTSPNGNYGYVLGTIHLNEGKIDGLDEITQAAYEDADALVLEIDLDPKQASENAALMAIDPVSEALSEEELMELKEILKQYPSIPTKQIDGLNLGTLNLLATQDIVKEAGYSTKFAIDSHLYYKAKTDKKKFYELESYREQMELVHELGITCKELTIEGLRHKEEAIEANKQMILDYQNGDLEALEQALSNTTELTDDTMMQQQHIFYQKMVIDRNYRMLEKFKEMLNRDEVVFVAIGAGHVLGEEGLVKLLQLQGYQVTVQSQ